MVVPPKHPKMIIFSGKTPWLLGTTIQGNLHILPVPQLVFGWQPSAGFRCTNACTFGDVAAESARCSNLSRRFQQGKSSLSCLALYKSIGGGFKDVFDVYLYLGR